MVAGDCFVPRKDETPRVEQPFEELQGRASRM